ncbi:MAG TPA: amidohydrolase [Methylomirabilota bacterium]|nr:amidohydrolase [Methylomirabilota bacterium]
MRWFLHFVSFLVLGIFLTARLAAAETDLILHNGKVVTVDSRFSIQQALAVRDGRLAQVGKDRDVLKLKGPRTELIDLQGRMVVPGLMDSHTHPTSASMTEFDHPIPEMESMRDVLDYIAGRAKLAPPGDWIVVQQVFITRLREQRYPTRAELDAAAPQNPVMFRTGPDASLNSLALKLSGIDRHFKVSDGGAGFVEKDATTGEPTGILRNCSRFVPAKSSVREASAEEKRQRLVELFRDYNSVGLTTIGDRDASVSAIDLYKDLRARKQLSVRVAISQDVPSIGDLAKIQEGIRKIGADPLYKERDDWLRIIGIKTFLDGGMLTGSAYMQKPWGVSDIYAITDPAYRGVLFIPKDRLRAMVRTTVESGLQFTAHSVGDGAVQALLDVYGELSQELPVRATRPCITHANFQTRETVQTAARLGVVMDIQPAWLYLDTRTLMKQFGYDRLRWFQPLRSLARAGVTVGGGSDHMQKIGSFRAINPYNPFLAMQTAITRKARWYEGKLHPEESLNREQALRMYTINNARLLFCEETRGSLEAGKLADFAVLDTDLLKCPEERISATRVLRTYVGGKLVYEAGAP